MDINVYCWGRRVTSSGNWTPTGARVNPADGAVMRRDRFMKPVVVLLPEMSTASPGQALSQSCGLDAEIPVRDKIRPDLSLV